MSTQPQSAKDILDAGHESWHRDPSDTAWPMEGASWP
jgi:hypothetical protein